MIGVDMATNEDEDDTGTEDLSSEDSDDKLGPFYGPIVSRMKPARLDAKLTLDAIAAKVGWKGKYPHTQASRVERGVKVTTTEKLQKWFDACGCDVYIVPRERAPGANDALPLVAALDDQQRALVLRIARLLRANPAALDRLSHDVDYFERGLKGRG
jgi:transcriptional regulator with XRE-family HTH domain